ncbi:MAG: signal peptidase II, partial [Lactobacillales bacterium]|nr:signal peptidase II [Lactobacillales bacterium]
MNKQQIRHFILLIFAIFLIIIDQLIKFIVMQNIAEGKNIDFIPKILSIAHVHNSAAAWNLLNGHIYLLTFITIIASGVIFYYFWQST